MHPHEDAAPFPEFFFSCPITARRRSPLRVVLEHGSIRRLWSREVWGFVVISATFMLQMYCTGSPSTCLKAARLPLEPS